MDKPEKGDEQIGSGGSPRNAPGILRVDTSRSRIVVQVRVYNFYWEKQLWICGSLLAVSVYYYLHTQKSGWDFLEFPVDYIHSYHKESYKGATDWKIMKANLCQYIRQEEGCYLRCDKPN